MEKTEKTFYMNQVYDPKEIKETGYYKEIEEYLDKLDRIHPTDYKLKEAKVRDIKSVTVVPEEIYKEKKSCLIMGWNF